MTLNRRLLLGVTPLLLILLVMGGYAIYLFSKLGGAIDVILRENYASIVASQNMKESADRMEAGILLALDGQEQKGKDIFEKAAAIFEVNSDIESKNITLPGEGDLENQMQQLHQKTLLGSMTFFAIKPGDPQRLALYTEQLSPLFETTVTTADKILQMNQDNMFVANNSAKNESAESSRLMILAVSGGMITAATLTYVLARIIVRPIANLTESVQQMGDGNLDQYVLVRTGDELGKLAEAFNKMAAKLRAYRQSTTDTLLQAQQTTESALRAFPDPIIVFSVGKEIKMRNAAGEEFFKQLGGGLELLGSLTTYIDESLKTGTDFRPTSFDKAIPVTMGNAEKYFLPRVLTMRNETGSITGSVVALQDVTRLRIADDVKTNLIATVSHELKTPLTSIQMAVYLLLEERVGMMNPKQTDLLLAARTNSERLLDTIEQLLDLARFEGGSALIDTKPVPSGELIAETAKREEELVTSRGLRLVVNEEPHLPPVLVSKPRIQQVFSNLIFNAIKYSPPGGTITLSAAKEGEKAVRFTVKDEGCGVPKELTRRIFEKFFRVSEETEGVGLGLSIAQEIVLAHGGHIELKSEVGKGSEFFFTIPSPAV